MTRWCAAPPSMCCARCARVPPRGPCRTRRGRPAVEPGRVDPAGVEPGRRTRPVKPGRVDCQPNLSESNPAELPDLFAVALSDVDHRVRRSAVRGLAATGAVEAVADATGDASREVRIAVAEALGTVGGPARARCCSGWPPTRTRWSPPRPSRPHRPSAARRRWAPWRSPPSGTRRGRCAPPRPRCSAPDLSRTRAAARRSARHRRPLDTADRAVRLEALAARRPIPIRTCARRLSSRSRTSRRTSPRRTRWHSLRTARPRIWPRGIWPRGIWRRRSCRRRPPTATLTSVPTPAAPWRPPPHPVRRFLTASRVPGRPAVLPAVPGRPAVLPVDESPAFPIEAVPGRRARSRPSAVPVGCSGPRGRPGRQP